MAAFNELLEMYAGDTRTIRMPIQAAEVALLEIATGQIAEHHIEFWLADKSKPVVEQIRVRLTKAEGVALVVDAGKWFVQVPLLEEHTGALPAPFSYYIEARVSDTDDDKVMVTSAGTLKIYRSLIAGSLLSGDLVPPEPIGSPTLAAVERAETAAATAEAAAVASGLDADETDADRIAAEAARVAAVAAAGTATAQAGIATTKAGEAAQSALSAAQDRAAVETARNVTIAARDVALGARDAALVHAEHAQDEREAIDLQLLTLVTEFTVVTNRTLQTEQAQLALATTVATLASHIIQNA
jgi:hypothetical protein